jgi:hypothetical protein
MDYDEYGYGCKIQQAPVLALASPLLSWFAVYHEFSSMETAIIEPMETDMAADDGNALHVFSEASPLGPNR